LHFCRKEDFRDELPPTFLIYFDGWSCNGEHNLCMFATRTNRPGAVVPRLIACAVQDLPAADEDPDQVTRLFGFTAEDLDDEAKRVLELEKYERDFDSLCIDRPIVNKYCYR